MWIGLWVLAAACVGPSQGDTTESGGSTATSVVTGDPPKEDLPGPDLSELLCSWTDHPQNPLIEPPPDETLIADPTVALPSEAPDGRWHLFANSVLGIHHHVSDDGIVWERLTPPLFGPGAFRPYLYMEGGTYFLFFEQFFGLQSSKILASTSTDLNVWSEPVTVLIPELPWEMESQSTVGNPFLVARDGGYWLYYSASGVKQPDTMFAEPKYIGVARGESPLGPFTKEPEPIIAPSPDDPYRNQNSGSLKLLDERPKGEWVALNNGIYTDSEGKSRSAIRVLRSADGLSWTDVCPGPIIMPEGDGWKSAFVYAFDTVRVGGTLRLYYNARDGWAVGTERIGLATAEVPPLAP